MNYVCLSPHFPPNYINFSQRLKDCGANVLAIGSEPYDSLPQTLKEAMTEYYRVDSLEDDEALVRACGHFVHRYGRLNRVESHNEHWLFTDAGLRSDFNVPGLKKEDMGVIKYKSRMKELFQQAGVPVARGKVFKTREEALALINEMGYPVCAKPDSGVGASHTYKLKSGEDLDRFLQLKPPVDYIMEEFIEGEIHTFDGLTDSIGRVVFQNSYVFDRGVMETVNDNLDMFYHNQRVIPEDLLDYGLKVVEAFQLKERFFHIEFFRTGEGKLIVMEVNVRPPGGLSMDLFNYATEGDLYLKYAQLVTGQPVKTIGEAPYHVAYAGLKQGEGVHHVHSQEEILTRYGQLVIHQGPIDSIFAPAIGHYAYVLRHEELAPLKEAAAFILERV